MEGPAVHGADKQFLFGDPAGFGHGPGRIFDEFKGPGKNDVVKRVVVEGEIFGRPLVVFDPAAGSLPGDVDHGSGRIEPG